MATLIERLRDEADQCRNDGADDIAKLLDEAAGALAARPDPDEVLRLFSEYRSMMAKAVFEATQGNDITAGSLEIAADDAASELVKLLKGGE